MGIAVNNIRLKFTSQALIAGALRDPDATFDFAEDGESVTITSEALGGLELTFFGTDLSPGDPDAAVDGFELVDPDTGLSFDMILPEDVFLDDLIDTANAGTGPVNALNYALFFAALMPQLFYFLLYTGSNLAEVMEGYRTNDEIALRGGNDRMLMGEGQDVADGGEGKHDTVDGSALAAGMTVNLAAGEATINGTPHATDLTGFEDVSGTAFADSLSGDARKNKLDGKDGNDTLNGGGNGDRLNGGKGNDKLNGGDGGDFLAGGDNSDVLNGEAGDDVMSGGRGPDRFVFGPGGGEDIVLDFEDGRDTLDLRGFGFSSAEEAKALAQNVNGNVVFMAPNGNTLTVENMTVNQVFDDSVLT